MPVKKVQSDNLKVKKQMTKVSKGLSVPVYSLAGVSAGTLSLPKEVFGAKVNKKLLAQALRVYTFNQKSHNASTKTRGEVRGSTAKIFRQKGTGNARHGSKRAPIFVGGGIVFGPKPRNVKLELPTKMKKAALISALSDKMAEKMVVGLSGLDKASGKTKEMAKLLKKVNSKSALIVTKESQDNVVRSVRNIRGVSVKPVKQINAFEVLNHKMILVTKEAIEELSK